ncbi:hypothetical protein [Janthinobacterium sp.]|uniref:hypothetical protein n=1 Tax=Janthinobacterium sp. TaxID=1871054 RepID=UPI00293D8561|nr:hypothetical protein [Janthinobacterium sp.]
MKLGKPFRIGFEHVVIFIRLHQTQRPKQLPFGGIVASLQGIEPLQSDDLGHERFSWLGGRWRRVRRRHDRHVRAGGKQYQYGAGTQRGQGKKTFHNFFIGKSLRGGG